MTTEGWYWEERISTVKDLFETLQSFPTGWRGDDEGGTWIYRGQTDAQWSLETTFDRVRNAHFPDGKREDGKPTNETAVNQEVFLVRSFKRQAHLYLTSPPDPDAHLEWRALLRHYSGPTRLMDWTYSPYIATFFALREALGSGKDPALWAIKKNWLSRLEEMHMRSIGRVATLTDFDDAKAFERVFLSPDPNTDGLVISANPYRLNERLQLQQGLFLIPLRMDSSFEDNLKKMGSDGSEKSPIKKFVLEEKPEEPDMIKNVLRRLRKMNITTSSLFPGLDGYAQSLNFWPLYEYGIKEIGHKRERTVSAPTSKMQE